MSIEIWDWGLGYIYLWDILIAWWWGSQPEPDPVLFDFWDWTNSAWVSDGSSPQWTVTKYSNKITFANSTGYAINLLSWYDIDWTKDFILEMNANIPNTGSWYNNIMLAWSSTSFWFETSWSNNYKMNFNINWSHINWNESNPWTADFFIKKEWTVLTMGRWWAAKYTNTSFTFENTYRLYEQVYRDTLTINTAKLTYL